MMRTWRIEDCWREPGCRCDRCLAKDVDAPKSPGRVYAALRPPAVLPRSADATPSSADLTSAATVVG